uniref:Uncharacterized protein n=1 Tax=Anguilla anguilla TaxID=7936 RepID=A0A0E9QTW3_ANGAN
MKNVISDLALDYIQEELAMQSGFNCDTR